MIKNVEKLESSFLRGSKLGFGVIALFLGTIMTTFVFKILMNFLFDIKFKITGFSDLLLPILLQMGIVGLFISFLFRQNHLDKNEVSEKDALLAMAKGTVSQSSTIEEKAVKPIASEQKVTEQKVTATAKALGTKGESKRKKFGSKEDALTEESVKFTSKPPAKDTSSVKPTADTQGAVQAGTPNSFDEFNHFVVPE